MDTNVQGNFEVALAAWPLTIRFALKVVCVPLISGPKPLR